jgi:hypothetical protein
MTPEQFCMWLEGYLAGTSTQDFIEPGPIEKKLALLTRPTVGDAPTPVCGCPTCSPREDVSPLDSGVT